VRGGKRRTYAHADLPIVIALAALLDVAGLLGSLCWSSEGGGNERRGEEEGEFHG
jgi:hypothetical protein